MQTVHANRWVFSKTWIFFSLRVLEILKFDDNKATIFPRLQNNKHFG